MDELIPWNNNIEDMILMQNSLWYYGDQAYGKQIENFSTSQKVNWWLSYNEVPIDTKYTSPNSNNSGFAFALPAGAKSLKDFITRKPVGSVSSITSTSDERLNMIANQLDLLYFGRESGKTKDQAGDQFIGDGSWMYELQTLPTGVKGPNNISEYYRNFEAIEDFSIASFVDPSKTYQIEGGMLEIVATK